MTITETAATPRPWKGATYGIAGALVANLAILLAANALLDGSIQVVEPGATAASDLPVAAVVGASALPVLVGGAGLWVLARMRPQGALRLWSILALILAVVSIAQPLALDVPASSKLALALMHLATGAAAVAGQKAASGSE